MGLGLVAESIDELRERTEMLKQKIEVKVIPLHSMVVARVKARIDIERGSDKRNSLEDLYTEATQQQQGFTQQVVFLEENILSLKGLAEDIRSQMGFLELVRDLGRIGKGVLTQLETINSRMRVMIADFRSKRN